MMIRKMAIVSAAIIASSKVAASKKVAPVSSRKVPCSVAIAAAGKKWCAIIFGGKKKKERL